MMKITSRRIFGLDGKIRSVGSSSRISQTRQRLMAIEARMPLMMLASMPAEIGIWRAWMDCSVVDASSAIQGMRHGKSGTPNRWQIRLINSPAKGAAIVHSH